VRDFVCVFVWFSVWFVGGVALILFPAPIERLKGDDPRPIFFGKIRTFSGIDFYIDVSDFWEPLGAPFSALFPNCWHNFPTLFGTSILY